MGKIIWTTQGPFEVGDWGGLTRVPPDDPRINPAPIDSSLKKKLNEVTTDTNGDIEMDKETGKRTADQAGITNSAGPSTRGRRAIPTGPQWPALPAPGDGSNNMDADMPDAGDGQGQLALMAGGAGSNPQSKETPISPYPGLTYGLQETHTTILPWTGWITVVRLSKQLPTQVPIRMNTPYDLLNITTLADPGSDTRWGSAKSIGAIPSNWQGYRAVDGVNFPAEFTSGASVTTERPHWLFYWGQLYQKYTVLGCEWKVVVRNPCHHHAIRKLAAITGPPAYTGEQTPVSASANAVCAVQYDSYSDTATSTGNIMPLTNYGEVRSYKHIDWYDIKDKGATTVITGTSKPGQIHRNIVNDGDVKTWSDTNAVDGTLPTLPTLKEFLTLNFWQDPLNDTVMDVSLNLEITCKYIVQFKDLRQQARYPNTVTTDQDLILTLNESLNAQGTPHYKIG